MPPKTAALLQKYNPNIYALVPASLAMFEDQIKQILIEEGVEGRVIPSDQTDQLKPHLLKLINFYKKEQLPMTSILHSTIRIKMVEIQIWVEVQLK